LNHIPGPAATLFIVLITAALLWCWCCCLLLLVATSWCVPHCEVTTVRVPASAIVNSPPDDAEEHELVAAGPPVAAAVRYFCPPTLVWRMTVVVDPDAVNGDRALLPDVDDDEHAVDETSSPSGLRTAVAIDEPPDCCCVPRTGSST
jgi:hypothetical protein